MIKFDAVKIAKFAISGVVGMGTHKIVSGFIKNNVEPKNFVDKAAILVGSWAVSGIVTTAAKKFADESVDDVVEYATTLINNVKIDNTLGKINSGVMTFEASGLDASRFEKNVQGKWIRKVPPTDMPAFIFDQGKWKYDEKNKTYSQTDDSGKTWVITKNIVTDRWELTNEG